VHNLIKRNLHDGNKTKEKYGPPDFERAHMNMEIKMNNFYKVIAAGILTVSALGGTAFADNENSGFAQMVRAHTYGEQATQQSGNFGYGYQSGFLTKADRNDGINVRSVSELPLAEASMVKSAAVAEPGRVQALQAGIDANVAKGLQARNISVNDVIGVSKALDGSTTYIVR
jgi:hypothetical protein